AAGAGAAPVVIRLNQPSAKRSDAEHGKELTTRPQAPHHPRFDVVADGEVPAAPRKKPGESLAVFLKLVPERIGHLSVCTVGDSNSRIPAHDARFDQFLRSRHRQGLQTDAVEELKDGRVRPDAERE